MDSEHDLMVGDAARELGVSPRRVQQLADRGQLASRRAGSKRTRIFEARDVEALRAERAAHPPKPGRTRRDPEASK